ncbi:neuropeptide S receptor-like [Tachypleus tridentatus]|uniref:neuropeptide S receptor-like n=1 Tax=Tachypleus tridentatus TaxID=6853 RepID=UPI003FD65BA8
MDELVVYLSEISVSHRPRGSMTIYGCSNYGLSFCPFRSDISSASQASLPNFHHGFSNYMLLAIALDRHSAIVYPLFRNARTKALITSAWVLSLLPFLINAYIFQTVTLSDGKTFCVAKFYTSSLSFVHKQVYMALILLVVFILPILIIIILYSRIIYTMWTRSGSLNRFRSRKEHFIDPKRKERKTKRECLNSSNSHISRAKVKTLKMTLIIASTFLTASTPYLVQEIVIAFGNPSFLNQNLVAFFGIFQPVTVL